MQNRFKSKVFWTAIAAQIVSILVLTGIIDTGLGETINAIVAVILQGMVAIGIMNNPSDSTKL